MNAPYEIVQVHGRLTSGLEQSGTKQKFWYRRTIQKGDWWLFTADDRKAGTSEKTGTGEDWAEKIVCEICERLGIPHVHYDLAIETSTGVPGVVCRNIAPPSVDLVLGNQLMLERDPSYPSTEEKNYVAREHTVDAVAETVGTLQPPPAQYCQHLPAGVRSALDIFVGYVMLDALVANQDRHHGNWGALRTGESRLVPTFDHKAALARNEPDEKRQRRLHGPDPNYSVDNFVAKARSSFYTTIESAKPLKTLEAFDLFAKKSPDAAESWLCCLNAFPLGEVESIVARIPEGRMTALAREFTLQLLQTNTRRLLSL